MPIPYEYIHTNFIQTSESTPIGEVLQRVLAVPQKNGRDLFLIVALKPEGYAVLGMNDFNEALKDLSLEADIGFPIRDFLILPDEKSKTTERGKQGYRMARNIRDTSYKKRLVVLEAGEPIGLLVSTSLAPGDLTQLSELALQVPNQRFVNVDFAPTNDPDPLFPLDHSLPLQTGQTYYFYLEIRTTPGGLDETPKPLPPDLPAEAELDVVVFGYPQGLRVQETYSRGRLKLNPDGTSRVIQPAAEPTLLRNRNARVLQYRLYFPVDTPTEPGEYRLRCLIYYGPALVQARIITALVGTPAKSPSLHSRIDYTLSHFLDPAQLSRMSGTRLSLFMNDNKDGTHTIAIQGQGLPESPPLHLDEDLVKGWVKNIRGDMRQAAWGDREDFTPKKIDSYRYKKNELKNLDRLQEDLIRLAISGWWIYDEITMRLGKATRAELAQLLRHTSEIQFSAIENVTSVVPVAAIYDYPLDTSYAHDLTKYELCAAFKNAFQQTTSLKKTDCFKGQCPSYGDGYIVCPSGFWGYRHNLGVPVSVGQASHDAATFIPSGTPVEISVGQSTAANLELREKHMEELSAIPASWDYYESHEEVVEMLQKTKAQVVYFYCHGGIDKKSVPFLLFEANSGPRFYPDVVQRKEVDWSASNPLVFINGCYTTALDPEKTMNFVDRFVQFSRAAGVIGTEITIFESTALIFAKAFFERFLVERSLAGEAESGMQRQAVGEAVRGARLSLLHAGSPFGLVYIPFVLPALKIENIISA